MYRTAQGRTHSISGGGSFHLGGGGGAGEGGGGLSTVEESLPIERDAHGLLRIPNLLDAFLHQQDLLDPDFARAYACEFSQ